MEDANDILEGLPPGVREAVTSHCEPFELRAGQILREQGDTLAWSHLPYRGVLAALTVLHDGRTVETGLIGREGATPTYLESGPRASRRRLLALTDVEGCQIRVEVLHALAMEHAELREAFDSYGAVIAKVGAESLACIAHHGAAARLARLLLRLQDRTGSTQLFLTQQQLADLLAVQRTSVNEAAQALQALEAIRYSRGRILIRDREQLERAACECYSGPPRRPDADHEKRPAIADRASRNQ
ncbi:MAG TPA: helix-turn-helix domain-containing protein [Brevundimonas sp.]|jgi:CRP-like cAMP-binding protein|uniref:Crp/Fnr family transcriptional regulator n=1 Tax=Brevundimonas sp. TaxID=1871086 RepID=UPI002DE774AD|nr:helix-turn-helix domain-containing protein [Brevundimonas sp.]